MKMLDLSLSQKLAKPKNSPYLKTGTARYPCDTLSEGSGKTKGFDEGSVAVEDLDNKGKMDDGNTEGVRKIFGGKNERGEKPEKERDLKNCRGYIIKILGLKDYSVKELQNKALKLGYKIEDIKSILDQLILDNWVNDERLAENLIECYNGRKGKAWLQQKLNMRLIDKEIVTKVLSEINTAPSESLKKQVEAKYRIKFGQYIEPKVKQKIVAFLAGRGYGNVFGVLKEWESGN